MIYLLEEHERSKKKHKATNDPSEDPNPPGVVMFDPKGN